MNNTFKDVAMPKNANDKNIASDEHKLKDLFVAEDVKKSLVKEVQASPAKPASTNNFFSLENLGHSFNKMVASATGSHIDYVADALSQRVVDSLHHGKVLEEQIQKNKQLPLSETDHLALKNYATFKNAINRQIPGFDHDALMSTLNARIAERASKTQEPVEASHKANDPVRSKDERGLPPTTSAKTVAPEKAKPDPVRHSTDVSSQTQASQTPSSSHIEKTARSVSSVSNSLAEHHESKGPENIKTQQRGEIANATVTKPAKSVSTAAKLLAPEHAKNSDVRGRSELQHQSTSEKSIEGGSLPSKRFQNFVCSTRLTTQTIGEKQTASKPQPPEKLAANSVPLRSVHLNSHLDASKPNTLSNFLAVSKLSAGSGLTDKAAKFLIQREASIHRSFLPAPERKSVLSGEQEKRSTRSIEQTANIPLRQSNADLKVFKNLGTPSELNAGKGIDKIVPVVRTEGHLQSISKATPARESFRSAESLSNSRQGQTRIELISSVSIKIDGLKHLNLPISNLLARLSSSSFSSPARRTDASIGHISTVTSLVANLRPLGSIQRTQLSDRSVKRSPCTEDTLKNQPKEFVVTRGQMGQRHYIFGSEIAFVAMLAISGIAKTRQERVIPQDIGSQSIPKPNPDLASEVISNKIEVASETNPEQAIENSASFKMPVSLSEIVERRISNDIESFAIPTIVLLEIKANRNELHLDSQKILKQLLVSTLFKDVAVPQLLFRPVVLVEMNDTLQSIAERYYKDIRIGWLIADLNVGNVRESYVDAVRIVSLQSRQTLTLPIWTDIESFYENDLADLKIENLVTVVEASQIDIELYADTFSNVIDNKSKRN